MIYDLELWASDMILFATHSLVIMIICAILFINPNKDNQVTGRHEQGSLKYMHKV